MTKTKDFEHVIANTEQLKTGLPDDAKIKVTISDFPLQELRALAKNLGGIMVYEPQLGDPSNRAWFQYRHTETLSIDCQSKEYKVTTKIEEPA